MPRSGRDTSRRLLTVYFGPWLWERAGNGRLYEVLGVRVWKRFLRCSGRPQNRWLDRFDVDRRAWLIGALRRQAAFTREYELRHLAGGAVMQGGGVLFIALVGDGSLWLLTLANLLFNGYPILLQRYNRVRVVSALARAEGPEGRDR